MVVRGGNVQISGSLEGLSVIDPRKYMEKLS